MNRKVVVSVLLGLFLPVISLAANPILEKMEQAAGGEIIFTESELNSFFSQELKAFQKGNFAKDLKIELKDGSVAVSAQLLKPFKGKLSVEGSAAVKDGKLVPKIKSVRYGWLKMPARFAEIVGNYALDKERAENWFAVPGMEWKKFELKAGEVLVQLGDVSR